MDDDNFVGIFDKSSSGQLIIEPCTIKTSEQTNETVTRKVQILLFGKMAEISGEYLSGGLSAYAEVATESSEHDGT